MNFLCGKKLREKLYDPLEYRASVSRDTKAYVRSRFPVTKLFSILSHCHYVNQGYGCSSTHVSLMFKGIELLFLPLKFSPHGIKHISSNLSYPVFITYPVIPSSPASVLKNISPISKKLITTGTQFNLAEAQDCLGFPQQP